MRNEILSKIDQRRARLAEIERERLTIEGELRAYADALHYFPEAATAKSAPPIVVAPPSTTVSSPKRRRGRRVSGGWANLLREVGAQHPTPFNVDSLVRAAAGSDFYPTRGNVRSQMAAYISRGLVSRVRDGEFLLTDTGRAEFGINRQENAHDVPDKNAESLLEELLS